MRSVCLLGGLLVPFVTGCQTFSPYGYPNDYVGPYGGGIYSAPSTNPPTGSTLTPTPAPNLGTSAQPWPRAMPTTNAPRGNATAVPTQTSPLHSPTNGMPSSKPVPNYPSSRAPATLGTPVDESPDSSTSSLNRPNGVRLGSIADDPDEKLSDLGDDGFAKPVPIIAASNVTSAAGRVSPYRKDRNGYAWLRGVVNYDEAEQKWRLTYTPEPSTNDPYQGNFILVGNEQLDNLLPDDVVLVEGTIEPALKDKRFGKPSYRVRQLKRLEPIADE